MANLEVRMKTYNYGLKKKRKLNKNKAFPMAKIPDSDCHRNLISCFLADSKQNTSAAFGATLLTTWQTETGENTTSFWDHRHKQSEWSHWLSELKASVKQTSCEVQRDWEWPQPVQLIHTATGEIPTHINARKKNPKKEIKITYEICNGLYRFSTNHSCLC